MAAMAPTVYVYRDAFDPPTLVQQRYVRGLAERGLVYVVPADEAAITAHGGGGSSGLTGNAGLSDPVHRAAMADLAFRSIPNVTVELCELDRMGTADDAIRAVHPAARVVPAPEVPVPDPGQTPPSAVMSYIGRHVLYAGQPALRSWSGPMDAPPRLFISYPDKNDAARKIAELYEPYRVQKDPNCILVVGGDGTMLHAVQQYWRCRVPFFGVNAGHLGFLLNSQEEAARNPFPPAQIVTRHLPMLRVDFQLVNDAGDETGWVNEVTFSDAWVERATGQSAWVEVSVDGRVRIPRLVGDGVLVSTAAGSTAYARAMGATPLLADTPAWLLVGNCVSQPPLWKSALLSMENVVEVKNVDPYKTKRPLRGYAWGKDIGRVGCMRARISRIASVELAFFPKHDLTEKINDHMWGRIATF
jgi:NAD kinase